MVREERKWFQKAQAANDFVDVFRVKPHDVVHLKLKAAVIVVRVKNQTQHRAVDIDIWLILIEDLTVTNRRRAKELSVR